MFEGIYWLGHASFRIEAKGVTAYFDPWKLESAAPADLILITHSHHDHFSPNDIAKIRTPHTVIVAPASVAAELQGDVRTIAPGESLQVGSATVEAVPSYNTNKPNHPKEAGNVGLILEVEGRRIYHAGDTDLIPEMERIRCDIALLPIGGTYTMNAREAAEAALRIRPKGVVPMHWRDIVGTERDVRRFKEAVEPHIVVAELDPE